MSRKRRPRTRPHDPAEAARKALARAHHAAEQAKAQRHDPGHWGENREALALEQNADVTVTPATRERTARLQRFDCFVTLGITVEQHQAVRRYQDELAIRYGVEGSSRLAEQVDGGGCAELVSVRSLRAAERIEALAELMPEPWMLPLVEALSIPAVVKGERVNWKAVVRARTGLIDRDAAARAVKIASEGVRRAWEDFDNGRLRNAA